MEQEDGTGRWNRKMMEQEDDGTGRWNRKMKEQEDGTGR